MNLFQLGKFSLASGSYSQYKIDCDALTDDDWAALAFMLHERLPQPFSDVVGVPTGGTKFADALTLYAERWTARLLVVDDVWTTGGSMKRFIAEKSHGYDGNHILRAVVFARGPVPPDVTALFKMI